MRYLTQLLNADGTKPKRIMVSVETGTGWMPVREIDFDALTLSANKHERAVVIASGLLPVTMVEEVAGGFIWEVAQPRRTRG